MDYQKMTTDRLPQAFLDAHCVQLAAWWGGSRSPLSIRLCWPSDLGRAEVSHATIKCVRHNVDGEDRLAIIPASEEDDAIINRNALAWLARRPMPDVALKSRSEPANTIGGNIG